MFTLCGAKDIGQLTVHLQPRAIMSFLEGYQSSTASERDFQSAQPLVGHSASDISSREDAASLDGLPEVGLGSPLLDRNPFGGEVDLRREVYADEYGANAEYEANGQLQPPYPQSDETLSEYRLSNYVKHGRSTAERELAASLDHARSKDLSIHLYNICKLKQAAQAKVPGDNGFFETKDPPKGWAAWPMPPTSVPREHEAKKWEDGRWRVGPYAKRQRRCGDELRELLTARALKTAKERLDQRKQIDRPKDDDEGGCFQPAIIADDDVATGMLKPSIQHVMGKLDGMLMDLHRSRSSYATMRTAKTKNLVTKGRVSQFQDEKVTRKQGTSSVEKGLSVEGSTHSDIENSVSNDSGLQKRQKIINSMMEGDNVESSLSRKGRLELRDWSDVLSIASMTGIDSKVVQRAASRCAALLGEVMPLRALHENPWEGEEIIYLPRCSTSGLKDKG